MSPHQRRCVVAAAIVGVHAVVLWYVTQIRQLHFAVRAADQPLIYIAGFEPPPPASETPGSGKAVAHIYHAPPPAPPTPRSGPGAPALLSPASPPRGVWDREAEDAARDMVDKLVKSGQPRCDDSAQTDSRLPKCRKHHGRFEWSPEPRRAGFENGLPYLRLGRCILVLGIIGCPVGAAPAANGHLFDDLKDPDRDRSSVPDINEINEPADSAPPHRSVLIDPAAHRGAAAR